jgi:ribosomal protein S11
MAVKEGAKKDAGAQKGASVPKKKKDVKITTGILTVKTTENNTVITLADENGNKIIGSGTGIM